MTPGVMGFLIGLVMASGMAVNFVMARARRRRKTRTFVVPDFTPRLQKPRAITRLRKENLTWEI